MCGITGVVNLAEQPPVDLESLSRMLAMLRHRGPDGYGIYRDDRAGLGSARLSIIDLAGGDQPIANEDGSLWIVFNGEIFNYVELRPELEARGHHFKTHTDTEVLLHLYEDLGPDCLSRLNGQFAIAIWDARQSRLFLARDRLGVRPLFYTVHAGRLLFGSELKSILAYPGLQTEIDSESLRQVFTFWSVQPPRTIFKDIFELPPGHCLIAQPGAFKVQPYWTLDFSEDHPARTDEQYQEEFESLLIDATRIRLRADVPVGAYLSGGLDSSVTAAIVQQYTGSRLETFSIAFSDPEFDESPHQRQMAAFLGTDHHEICCTYEDIGQVFPEVIWHTETPILRTAPAPMFLLSRLVHDADLKVVVTGEGADEFLAGYDLFKEMKIRRFWARDPESRLRPLLLKRLYPDISGLGSSAAYLKAFYGRHLAGTDSPFYSHSLRWRNTARTARFLARQPEEVDFAAVLPLPDAFETWSPLAQAQYLEIRTFLSPYLLSSQGDRMSMGHSVEGRLPFLDYRLVELCDRLPARLKLNGLAEKWLLKSFGQKLIPVEIWRRPKRPYRAPIHPSFFSPHPPDYVQDLMSETALAQSGYFNAFAAAGLAGKARSGARLSEVEDMALVGILSTQLVHAQFISSFRPAAGGLETLERQSHIKLVDLVKNN